MVRTKLGAGTCLAAFLLAAVAAFAQGPGLPTRSGHWIDFLEPASFAQRNEPVTLKVFGTGFINPTSCSPLVELHNQTTGTVTALPGHIESPSRLTVVLPPALAGAPGVYAVAVRFYTLCGYGVTEETRVSNAAPLEIARTDYSAPKTIIVSAPQTTMATSAVFEFSGSDDFTPPELLSFQCRLDGGAPAACAAHTEFPGLARGKHTLEVRAVDQAGNADPTPATHTWQEVWSALTDTVITSGPANNSATRETSATFTFTGSDDVTPPERLSFECSLDSISFVPCTSPQSYTNLTPMGHQFRVRARDSEGNLDNTPAAVFWYVDLEAPDTQIQSGPRARESRPEATFVFSSTDNSNLPRTYECKLDHDDFIPCTSPQLYFDLAAGAHTFLVRARDAAGNVDESPASLTWTIGR